MAEKSLNIAFMGDVMLGRGVNAAVDKFGPAYPWGNMLETLVGEADLRFINLECAVAAFGRPWARTAKTFLFRAGPAAIETLTLAKIDFAALANNHILDYEEEGLLETAQRLSEARIGHAGAGADQAIAAAPAYLKSGGMKLAAFSITDNEPGWAAGPGRPGTNYLPIDVDTPEFRRLTKKIAAAKKVVDLIVISAHWGPNMVERPPAAFRRFARAAIAAGADIFCGHSAHIFQGVEFFQHGLIMYDLGDFIDDYVVDPYLRNDLSFLFIIRRRDSRIAAVELRPIKIENYQVKKAAYYDSERAIKKMISLCKELGTTAVRNADRLDLSAPRKAGGRRREAA